MKYQHVWMFVAALLVGLGAVEPPRESANSPWLLAQSQAMNFTLQGKISKQSPGKLTVNSEENIIFHVVYNDQTEIKQKDGSAGSPKDLRVGVIVRVEGELTEAGEIIAQKIEIQPAETRKKP